MECEHTHHRRALHTAPSKRVADAGSGSHTQVPAQQRPHGHPAYGAGENDNIGSLVRIVLRSSSKIGVERALKSHVFDHVSLFSLANLPARAQTRAISTHVPPPSLTRTVILRRALLKLQLPAVVVLRLGRVSQVARRQRHRRQPAHRAWVSDGIDFNVCNGLSTQLTLNPSPNLRRRARVLGHAGGCPTTPSPGPSLRSWVG